MTDNDLLTLAYRAGLLDQIHLLAAVDPQRADMQKVEGPAHRAVLEFGRVVLEKAREQQEFAEGVQVRAPDNVIDVSMADAGGLR